MIACAKWLGHVNPSCAGQVECICPDKPQSQHKIFVLEGLIAREAGKPASVCQYKSIKPRNAWMAGWSYQEGVVDQ